MAPAGPWKGPPGAGGQSGGVGRAPAAGAPQPVAVRRPSSVPVVTSAGGGPGIDRDAAVERLRTARAADVLGGNLAGRGLPPGPGGREGVLPHSTCPMRS